MNNALGDDRFAGLILAGGAGQRVSHQDKGLLPWRGKPLIEHVTTRLRPQVRQLYISCNRNRAQYRRYADSVFTDLPDYAGPLAGLYSLPPTAAPLLLLAPCDTPLLPEDLATRLLQALQSTPGAGIAYATAAGRPQYLHAVLRRDCLLSLPAYLAAGGRSVHGWYAQQKVVTVEFEAQGFRNYNTPAAFL